MTFDVSTIVPAPDHRYLVLDDILDSLRTEGDVSLDVFIQLRSDALQAKLDVFAEQVRERLRLHVDVVGGDRQVIDDLINPDFTRPDFLHSVVYRREFVPERSDQVEAEDVACWHDITAIVRDWLVTWEALAQSQAKANLLSESSMNDEK